MPSHTPIVVTISRQMGSGATYLAECVARRLGFHFIDREVLGSAAAALGLDMAQLAEREDRSFSGWERLLNSFSVGPAESTYNAGPLHNVTDADLFVLMGKAVVELAAHRDTVLVGHAGFHVLRDRPGLVSVFVHAPFESRVRRIMEVRKLPEAKARTIVKQVDRGRERFVREQIGVHFADAHNYHLCIDTCRVGFEAAEAAIVAAVEHRRAQGAKVHAVHGG